MTVRVLGLKSGDTTAEGHRLGLTAFVRQEEPINGRSGVFPATGAAALATVSAMTCSIAPFNAWIDGTSSATQGGYPFVLDATQQVTIDPGNASTARTDRIIARVYDNVYDASGSTVGEIVYLKGNTSTGVAASIPANCIKLWKIVVPAGASAGTGGINFGTASTDERVWTTASGGVLPVNATDVAAIANTHDGLTIYRTDLGLIMVHDGTQFRPIHATVASAANLSTITNAVAGTMVWATAEKCVYVHNGSTWQFLVDPPTFVRKTSNETVTSSTSLQNDDELVLPYVANATYLFDVMLFADGATAGDLSVAFAFTATGGARVSWGPGPGPAEINASYAGDALFYARQGATTSPTGGLTFGLAGGTPVAISIKGILVSGSTSGTLQLVWGQGASSGTGTTVMTDSWMSLERKA